MEEQTGMEEQTATEGQTGIARPPLAAEMGMEEGPGARVTLESQQWPLGMSLLVGKG